MGWTALILASRESHCEIIDALIDHGADIDQKTEVRFILLQLISLFVLFFVVVVVVYRSFCLFIRKAGVV